MKICAMTPLVLPADNRSGPASGGYGRRFRYNPDLLKQLIRQMKLIMILLTLALVQAGATGYSQKITIREKNTPVEAVFRTIEKQTGYVFFYDSGDLRNAKISIDLRKASLSEALDQCFSELPLTYRIIGNTIAIGRKEKTLPESLILPKKEEVNRPRTGLSNVPSLSLQREITLSYPLKRISGKVTDENGEGLPGVNILVKGTLQGAVTDVEGNYTIEIPDETAILIFSFVGYTPREILAGNRTSLDVSMTVDEKSLEEVVVVGYGTQKKATLTGAISSIGGDIVSATPVTNVSNSLTGRIPGLTTVTRSGEPGNDDATIRIRGANTLGNNGALVVVDGIPGRSLNRIDPATIESITVLKDASAAIYGSQAANGVILVTTKRGLTGAPRITFNLNQGVTQPTRIPKLLNAEEYSRAINEINAFRNFPPKYSDTDLEKYADGSDPWLYPNTDWFNETFKSWSSQSNANLSIAGGSEFVKYYVAVGTRNQDAFYKNSATFYKQHDFRSNLDIQLSKSISIGFDILGRLEDRNFPMGNNGVNDVFRMLVRGKPNEPAYWPNGLPGPDIEFGSNPVVITTNMTGYDRDRNYVLNGNVRFKINVPWITGLSISGNSSLDKMFGFQKQFQKPWYLYSWDKQSYDSNGNPILIRGKKGVNDPNLTQRMDDNTTTLSNGIVSYGADLGGHSLNLMAGIEIRKGTGDWFTAFRRFFESTALDQLNSGGPLQMSNTGSGFHNARLNYFGRANYSYKEKYLAEFVWRVDGSYIFPEQSRFGFFPGVSLGWRITEEDFIKDSKVGNIKLRASYGLTGNDRIDEWQYLTSYAFAGQADNQVFNFTEEARSLYETRIPNPNVTWEVAKQGNIGIDASFLDNSIYLTADYFDYRRSNILWNRNASVPMSTGLTLPRENIGKVTNRGFDFEIGYRNSTGNFNYNISWNASYAKNRITYWDEPAGAPDWQRSTGSMMNTSLYYNTLGVFKNEADLTNYPHWNGARPGDLIFEDTNQDGVINANDRIRVNKNDTPIFQSGLGLNLGYKQLYFSLLLQGSTGAVRHILTESGEVGNYLKESYDGRWTPENPNADKPRLYNRNDQYWSANPNTYFLRKTDYIRLKNVELGYTIPEVLLQRLKLKDLKIYLSGYNLFTYSPDMTDFDPEDNHGSYMRYPLPRVLNIGLNLSF